MNLSFKNIQEAAHRIQKYVNKTPILTNQDLNEKLGAKIYFKCENFQITGSFKIRGACNLLLHYQQQNGYFPKKLVAASSGNHAQAVAYLAKKFGIEALIYMEKSASKYKINATKSHGAEVILTDTKKETGILANQKAQEGYLQIPPSDHPDIICGQGTTCLEAIDEIDDELDAVFAPCSGGGLIIGSYLACQKLTKKPKIFAVEPKNANDTAISYKNGKNYGFDETPKTIADGAKTLKLSDFNFSYIQKLDGVYEISEEDIIKWTQIITDKLKIIVEPTSVLGAAATYQFLKKDNKKEIPKILVILSGGNISADTIRKVWNQDYLCKFFKK